MLPAVAAAGLLVAAWDRADGPGPGEAVLVLDGTAHVVRADGRELDVGTVTLLHRGDRATMVDGTGTLEMAGDVHMAARATRSSAPDTSIEMGETPVLLSGDLLVESSSPVVVDAGTAYVAMQDTAARLRRAYSAGVAVYRGDATVSSAGRELPVAALREAQVSALGRLPARPRPLHYDAEDPWDQRYLGEAIRLGDELRDRSEAWSAGVDAGTGSAAFFAGVLPQLAQQPGWGDALVDERAPGETVVGAAIALLDREGSFADRWDATFGFRDEGAAWGLVALDRQVDADPLRALVDQAMSATPYQLAAFGAPGTTGTTGATTTTAGTHQIVTADGTVVTVGPDGQPVGGPPGTGGPGTTLPGGGGTTTTRPGGGGGGGSTSTTRPGGTTTTIHLPTTTTSIRVTTTTTIHIPTTLPTIPTTLPTIPTTLPTIPTTLPTIPTTLPTLPTTTSITLPIP